MKMAEVTGITASTLSKVERGQLSLTYDKLVQLVHALKIDVAELFTGPSAKPATGRYVLDRKDKIEVVDTYRYRYEFPAARLRDKLLIPLVVEPLADSLAEFGEFSRHQGEEFIHVLTGSVLFVSEFYDPMILRSGDCVYYDGTMGHAILRLKGKRAKFLSISSSPDVLHGLGISIQKSASTAILDSPRKRVPQVRALGGSTTRTRRQRTA
jgi:transcriptional regulator with XRE-family HTH domain